MRKREDITRRGFGNSKYIRVHWEGDRKIDNKAVFSMGYWYKYNDLTSGTIPIIYCHPSQSNPVKIKFFLLVVAPFLYPD